MSVEQNRIRLDKRTLTRLFSGGALLVGMSTLGGDSPRPLVAESFSHQPGLSQSWHGEAPWLGRDRMQGAPTVDIAESLRPSPRSFHVEPWQVAAAGIGTGFAAIEVAAAAQIIQGFREHDSKKKLRGGILALSPSLFFCMTGPALQELTATPTPANTAEVQAIASPTAINEILTATPNPPNPTEASIYPTEFIGGQPAGMYEYANQEGRNTMTPVLRGYNDRVVPELARSGYISGATVEQQYASFDANGFVMRYFEDANHNWTLLPYHPTYGYLVSVDANGLPYADMKLPYSMVFDGSGLPIDQGLDNFGVTAFKADGVQFFNGMPVLVLADNGTPTAALDMAHGGVEVALAVPTQQPEAQPTLVVPTVTSTEAPTAVPKLTLDATKRPGEWNLAGFTAEQQSWINLAMTDPDHAPIEAKNFYDQVRIQGIREQTGDQNITFEKYVEWLFTNGIHETGPLPFMWRKANLENVENLVPYNWNGQRGYLIEGYEGVGHDPNFGKPNQLFASVERDSLLSGIGGNISPLPDRAKFQIGIDARIKFGQNQTRDTIFGEPSLIIFPRHALVTGDIMGLTDIAGVDRNIAQEAIIRMFDERNGQARYTIIRVQYQDQIVQQGDKSCVTLNLDTSTVCPSGTPVPHSIISTWDDVRREHKMDASRSNMLQLFTFFKHPPFITMQTNTSDDLYMDGAVVTWDIKIPTVPQGYLP